MGWLWLRRGISGIIRIQLLLRYGVVRHLEKTLGKQWPWKNGNDLVVV
jgi:hypothetical protein